MDDIQNLRIALSTSYKGYIIQIWRGIRGGKCCELGHTPDKLQCDNCEKPIHPKTVFVFTLNDSNNIIGDEHDSTDEAYEQAVELIDVLHDRRNKDNPAEEDDPLAPPRVTPMLPPPTGLHDDLQVPPPAGVQPKEPPSLIGEYMEQMGWPGRLDDLYKKYHSGKE